MNWKQLFEIEKTKSYFPKLQEKLNLEYQRYHVYPERKNIFNAFKLTPFDQVRCVIIGQDPYHGVGQANGLAFSVNHGVVIPPSLKNIFKEIEDEMGHFVNPSGDLSRWAEQGVLLLNSVLTVRDGEPGSHRDLGWEIFTDNMITYINANKTNVVFLLWGKYAESKSKLISEDKNIILTSAHPSPLSASKGFFGNGHFEMTNKILAASTGTVIDWR